MSKKRGFLARLICNRSDNICATIPPAALEWSYTPPIVSLSFATPLAPKVIKQVQIFFLSVDHTYIVWKCSLKSRWTIISWKWKNEKNFRSNRFFSILFHLRFLTKFQMKNSKRWVWKITKTMKNLNWEFREFSKFSALKLEWNETGKNWKW